MSLWLSSTLACAMFGMAPYWIPCVECGGTFSKFGKQPWPIDCVVTGLAPMRPCLQFLLTKPK